jgi:hypothetical protein
MHGGAGAKVAGAKECEENQHADIVCPVRERSAALRQVH